MDKRATILVTAAGTATSIGVVKYISNIPGVRVVTTDTNPVELVPASKQWKTVHYQVPYAKEREAFITRLIEICIKERVDFLYPVHDSEIMAVAESRGRFPSAVLLPDLSAETVQACIDKWSNYSVCISAKLPVPDTWIGSKLPADVFVKNGELVRKPRSGVGSIGVRRVKSFDELTLDEDLNENVIYQTMCGGPEYTVDALRLESGFYAVSRERIETKAGVCTKARISVDPALARLARSISDEFALHGLFCFQAIREGAETFKIIDINPRCGGGTALTAAAGFPIYEAYYSSMLGLERAADYKRMCDERVALNGKTVVCRCYEEVVTQFSENGATSG